MNDFFCAAPWRGLHINPHGNVKTCCAGDPNFMGNLNTDNIDNLLNGKTLQEIRQEIRQGRPHAYCSNCVKSEAAGGTSERAWHNSCNQDFDFKTASLEYQYPTIMDVRWNTTCNLSCNYCDHLSSSKWASLLNIPVVSGTRHYYEQVCDFIALKGQHLSEVALVGGEPFLLPENNKLLDVIPKDCKIIVITNLSNKLKNNEIFQKICDRPNVGWSISFDNTGERFEYVRYGAQWDQLLENLDLVQPLLAQGHSGGIHAVYSMYNATRLLELKSFANQRNLSVKWQTLTWPDVLNIRKYGKEVAKLAANEIIKLKQEFVLTAEELDLFDSSLEYYQNSTQATSASTMTNLKNHIDQIETKYHPLAKGKFQILWPELAEVIWH